RIVGPQNDIDLLTAELIAHCGDTRPTHTHAGADGINTFIVPNHRNFSANSRVAGGCFDLQQTLFDFGDLVLEQLPYELGGGTRQNNLLTAGSVINPKYP